MDKKLNTHKIFISFKYALEASKEGKKYLILLGRTWEKRVKGTKTHMLEHPENGIKTKQVTWMETGNVVYVGKKPVMAYCLAVMTAMKGDASEVTLMARGRAISTAVDVAEVVRNQFLTGVSVKDISIGTEEVENEDGSKRNISNIAISLAKD
jgi:DNA-binding protein